MPNATSIATPVPCQQCGKILSSKRNLRRHEQKVHKILPPPPPQTVCDEFLESFESLSEAREQVKLVHDMTSNSHCIFCQTIFLTAESYGQHLLKKHALPVWDGIETTSSAAPTESAFRGKLRRYDLKVGEKEMDLLQVMMQNKEEIDALILERVKEGPNKVQGYALAVLDFGKKDLLKFELKRGPNVMEELISSLESLARQIYVEKRKYYTFTGITDQEREDATICWICENDFSDNDQGVLDHCHYTNKFLGWAHNECNVNRKTTNYIPVVAHNLSNYDLHFIIKALAKSDSGNTFSVIPASEEKKYILEM